MEWNFRTKVLRQKKTLKQIATDFKVEKITTLIIARGGSYDNYM